MYLFLGLWGHRGLWVLKEIRVLLEKTAFRVLKAKEDYLVRMV
jgi:hypothetical protein